MRQELLGGGPFPAIEGEHKARCQCAARHRGDVRHVFHALSFGEPTEDAGVKSHGPNASAGERDADAGPRAHLTSPLYQLSPDSTTMSISAGAPSWRRRRASSTSWKRSTLLRSASTPRGWLCHSPM